MDARAALHLGSIIVLTALASAVLIVLLKPLLARYALARPNARSSHKVPTPQGGGIAVIAATLVAVVAVALLTARGELLLEFLPLALSATLLAVVGALDDIKNIPVGPRFALQTIAVGVVVATLPAHATVLPLLPWWIERLLLVIAGVYVVNLVNFMDGIDWITVAEVIPITGGVIVLASLAAAPPLATLTAAALAGGTIGFAPFNRPVAKLFLGDVGSLPVGLILFWLMLQLAINGHLAAALLLPLYYLADATVTLVRRLSRGENVFVAHRSHFYQRALDKGWRVIEVVRAVFGVNLVLVLLAAATVLWPSLAARTGALALGAAAVTALLLRLQRP